MLLRLEISNLAIIEKLSVEFSSQLNVITGETGAGKSVLIKALGFLSGQKVGTELIRKGSDLTTVCGAFEIAQSSVIFDRLVELGVKVEVENGITTILVRRQLSIRGRSQGWINDIPVTVTAMRNVLHTLVDILSQHENQKLFDSSFHLDYLDKFTPDHSVKDQFLRQYQIYKDCLKVVEDELAKFRDDCTDLDYNKFRLEEFHTLNPSQKDFDELVEFCKHAGETGQLHRVLVSTLEYFEPRSGMSLVDSSQAISRLLNQCEINSTEMASLVTDAADLSDRLSDFHFRVSRELSRFEVCPGELENAQDRLAEYHELFRKFGVENVSSLMEAAVQKQEKIGRVENFEEKLYNQLQDLYKVGLQLSSLSKRLRKQREKAVNRIKKSLKVEFADLNMNDALLDFSFESVSAQRIDLGDFTQSDRVQRLVKNIDEMVGKIGMHGAERGTFLLSANSGESFHPLNKVVSGGEASRIILALKKVLADFSGTCVLVFDEIDTGISGETASKVGKKLKELSKIHQVISVSHLPQVAVFADDHFRISKSSGKRTHISMVKMNSSDSAKEIARLLSGSIITHSSLHHARDLKKNADLNT